MDNDNIETENIHMDMPSGLYHRIMLQGSSYTIDLYTPSTGSLSFLELRDVAIYLSALAGDDDIKCIVKKQILESNQTEVNKL